VSALPHSPEAAARVLLVGVDFGADAFDAQLQELALLARSAGLDPVARRA